MLAPDRHGRLILRGLHLDADAITGEDLRNLSIRELEARAELPDSPPPQAPLKRALGMPPEEFSALVAEHYLHHAARSANPVQLMVQSCGVSAPTVHGWVREARLRGLLPPASRGKAGLGGERG